MALEHLSFFGSIPAMLEPTPTALETLNNRLGHLADSFWLSTDPTKRAELLEEFRILLEQRDALIAREFQVGDWGASASHFQELI